MKLKRFRFSSRTSKNLKKAVILILTLIILSIISIYLNKITSFLIGSLEIAVNGSTRLNQESNTTVPLISLRVGANDSDQIRAMKKCNLFKGNWVPYPKGPYYTNETKCAIEPTQDCITRGRPDTEYMKWRWKPEECEIPLFDPSEFLELVRGKSMAFVGDSVARNQMQSLICLLTSVTRPLDISSLTEYSLHWFYPEYNFSLALLWSTHLVGAQSPFIDDNIWTNLTVDVADLSWAAEIETYDFVIISSGDWFLRPSIYYEKGKVVGCYKCDQNATNIDVYYAYRMAFRLTFRTLLSLPNYKGLTFVRTIIQTHADKKASTEFGEKGDCTMTRPFRKEEFVSDNVVSTMYRVQLEEFRAAEREAERRGLKFRVLNVAEAMQLRPDGHPSRYGHWPHEKLSQPDCLHWCLPGPVDLWNEILLQIMKMES